MSWQNKTTILIRNLINDSAGSTYADSQIEELALVAAYLVSAEINFETSYTVDISGCSINPDPSNDKDFIALVSLKAACIVKTNEAKTQANSAISMTDGPSSISLKGVYDALAEQAKEVCEAYEKAKKEFIFGNSVGGLAVLSPYSPGSDNAAAHSDRRDGASYFE